MKVRHLRKCKPRGHPLPRIIRVPIIPETWRAEYVLRITARAPW